VVGKVIQNIYLYKKSKNWVENIYKRKMQQKGFSH